MRKIAALGIATLMALTAGMATPGEAAENETTVHVALTDMSASMGMGPMGQMMMGPGYGWGPGAMGRGMMAPGYGWGPGLLGPNMVMSMMAIRIDRDTVKSGLVKFEVTNWSRSVEHEMLIVAVDNPAGQLPYDYDQAKVIEDQVKILGDTSELQPNVSHTLEVTLAPGSYLLVCNVPGHYAAGMATPFRVTP
jgi:uncharacterized cupredoxin-like copper-binding protein